MGNIVKRTPGLVRCAGHCGWHGRIWRHAANNGFRAVVLKYHRIHAAHSADSNGASDDGLSLPAATFERQLRFMLKHFAPVPVSALLDPDEPKPPLCFAVTFDDGCGDNLTVAAPILDRLGVPATFFVVGSYVGTERRFWWEQLAGILQRTDKPYLERGALGEWPESSQLPATLALRGRRCRMRAYRTLAWLLIRAPDEAIAGCLRSLADAVGAEMPSGPRDEPMMSWDGLRQLQGRGHEIGAHTMNHVNLGRVDGDRVRREIEQSVEAIGRELGAPPVSFAYPCGTSDCLNGKATDVLKGSECRGAFTVLPGTVGPSSSPWTLPRISLSRPSRFVWAYQICEAFRAGR